jgi:hypothetical protein
MELRQLKSFLKIAEVQSFSEAAKEMGYSQSALSVQIHSLEQELGVKLFDRMGRQVTLTPPGKNCPEGPSPSSRKWTNWRGSCTIGLRQRPCGWA